MKNWGFTCCISGLVSWLFLYLRVGFRNFLSGSCLVEVLVLILPSGGGGEEYQVLGLIEVENQMTSSSSNLRLKI